MPPYIVSGQDTRMSRVAWPLFLDPEDLPAWRLTLRAASSGVFRGFGIVAAAVMLLLAFWGAPVFGYVVQGPQAAALMTRALGSGSGVSVKQVVRFYDLNLDTDIREVTETAQYVFPDRYRSEIQAAGIHRIHVESGGRSVTVTDDRVTSRSVSVVEQYKDLLLCREPERLMEKLAGHGVNPLVTSLGRFGDVLVVVVGARYPDESRPQVWLDRDSYLPLRWIVRPDEDPGGPFEIQFSAWQEVKGQQFPRHIECYENNVLTREILVEQVISSVNARPGDFDVDELVVRYSRPPTSDETQGAPPASEIDKTIEDFRKRFE